MVKKEQNDDPMAKSVQALFKSAMKPAEIKPAETKPAEIPIVRNGKPVGLDGFDELNVDALEEELRIEESVKLEEIRKMSRNINIL